MDNIQCPKCSYIRKETDVAPDWQCPLCQVVYAKARTLSGGHQVELPSLTAPAEVPKGAGSFGLKLMKLCIGCFVLLVLFFAYNIHHKFDSTRVATSAVLAPDNGVIIYSTSRCGYCSIAKKYLADNNVVFQEYDLDTSEKGRQDFAKLGGWGVPVIVVGDKRIYGYNEKTLSNLLRSKGLLR